MYRRYSLLFCSVIALSSFLQSQPNLLWTTTRTNPDSSIGHHDVARDNSGNIYMITNIPTPPLGYGLVLLKYSNTGSLIREQRLPTIGGFGYKIVADKQGNAYVVVNDENEKLTLIKYSPTGDSLWAKKTILALPSTDYRAQNRLVAIDNDGNVCIATQHEQRKPSGVFRTYLMMRSYSPNGDLLWMDTTISALATDREPEYGDLILGKMQVDKSNNIYVSITYRSVLNPSLYIADTKTLKYAPASGGGSNLPKWIVTYSENPSDVEFSDMDVDDAGNLFVGYSGGKVRKYNAQGAFLWQCTVSGGMKVAADNAGGVYVGDGKFESFLKTVGRVFHFTDSDSTYVGNFGIGNYSSINHLAVDPGGYVGVSGYVKSSFSATEGSYYFMEYAPSGTMNGTASYASPGISYEYPHFLFKGNGSYTVVGQSVYPKNKAVLWIGKIQVAPVVPPNPGKDNDGTAELKPIEIASGTSADLRGVWFNTPLNGFIVGDSSTILHSTDAGRSWTKQTSPIVADFQKVRFMNADTGFIIGTGCILRTSNGGVSWVNVNDVAPQTMYGIAWNDKGRVLAVGSNGLIRLSTDYGVTWLIRNYPTTAALRDVAFDPAHSSSFIYAGGDGGLLISSNTWGESWDLRHSSGVMGENIRSIYNIDGYPGLFSVGNIMMENDKFSPPPPFQINSTNRYHTVLPMVGVGSGGNIVSFTTDFTSYNYTLQNIGQHELFDVFRDGLFAIVVGAGGKIYQLIDGQIIPLPQVKNITSFVMMSRNEMLLSDITDIWKTNDGGTHWEKAQGTALSFVEFHRTFQTDTIFANSKNADDNKYLRSTNRGVTWTLHSSPDSLFVEKIISTNDKTVWMGTSSRFGHRLNGIYRTTNNGDTWIRCNIDSIALKDWDVLDGLTVYAVEIRNDSIYVMKSSNAGVHWETKHAIATNQISAELRIIGEKTVLVQLGLSQTAILSTDGGGSWAQIQLPKYIEHAYERSLILFSQLSHSLAGIGSVTNNISSDDGGISWRVLPLPTFATLIPIHIQDLPISLRVGKYARYGFGDSTYYVSSDSRSLFIHDPKPINQLSVKFSLWYNSRQLNKITGPKKVLSDTIVVSASVAGRVARDVSVWIDSLECVMGKTTILVEHVGITDTLFYRHGNTQVISTIINCAFSDISPYIMNNRMDGIRGEYFVPFSSLTKFNGVPAEGKWIFTVISDTSLTSRLTGWSLYMGTEFSTGVDNTIQTPSSFSLSQNYPNPFNPTTTINYQLPMNSKVSLKIYDILGREVSTLVNEVMNAGSYSMPFIGSRFASGVYFYRIEAAATNGLHNRFTDVKKMILLK